MKRSLKNRIEALERQAEKRAKEAPASASFKFDSPEEYEAWVRKQYEGIDPLAEPDPSGEGGVYTSKWIRELYGIIDPISEAIDAEYERKYGPIDHNVYTMETHHLAPKRKYWDEPE